jgi:hypothetical protein
MVNAVVFVLTRHLLPDAELCISYCIAHGYNMIGVVKDDWTAATQYLYSGKAHVLVAADARHVDPDRQPRVEFVADHGPSGRPRTRIIQRSVEA